MPNLSTLQGQTTLDVETLRRDFPILARRVHDRPLVYLDSAASSQKPQQVLDAVNHYYQTSHANIHRGVYLLSEEATIAYEQAHERVAHFIHADWEEMIFTKNTTEGLNLVAYAWGLQHLRDGDEVVLTQLEHHSNIVPWQQIARRTGAVVRYIRIDAQGHLDMEHAASLIGRRTKMVSVAHVSNVLGTVNQVDVLGQMAHAQGALLCVDGAQSIPHMAIDVRALDCDFFAFSGHKMLGPTGIGGLYGKRHILEQMEPFLYGGDMISEVTFEGASWNDLPWKFEAGTPPIAQGIGLAAAVVSAGPGHGGRAGPRTPAGPLCPGAATPGS
jgi:cysteine desulfurase/selenocysteine lyase